MVKRPADAAASEATPSAAAHKHKRSRAGLRAALPTTDDAWRRKLEHTKEANVRRAKVRQAYAKIKARVLEDGEEQLPPDAADDANAANAAETMHPDRLARIDDEDDENYNSEGDTAGRPEQWRRDAPRHQRQQPAPFQKAREEAAQRKAEAEARQADFERRTAEREAKQAERARRQKAMAKARRVREDSHGGNQRRKLGRESGVLLDRVRRLMGQS